MSAPLALLILDRDNRICEFGYPRQAEEFREKVERWNLSDRETGYRVVPVGEIPAWLPIESAPRDKTDILVYEPAGRFSAELVSIAAWNPARSQWEADETVPNPTHWQPLPAAPEAES